MDQNTTKKPRFPQIRSDFHMHSYHSGDSDTPMEDQIRAALSLGLSSVCFTEHLDMDWPYQNTPDLEPGTFDLDLAAYRQEYLRLRDKYRDRLHIFYGVELGLQPHLGDRLGAFTADHPEFDFILGSTHVSRQMDPYYSIFFEGRTEEEAYRTYFTDSLLSLRAFHQIDSYGHMDYVVRYGPNQDRFYSYERYRDVIDPILDLLLEHDIALEINTAGLSKGLSQCNPCTGIVRRYRQMGGQKITVGADAHAPAAVAAGFDTAAAILTEAGFDTYYTFEGRQAVPHRIL